MNTELSSEGFKELINDYSDFYQLKLQVGDATQEREYIKHLEKLFLTVTPLLPSIDVVMQKAITVLLSEFLFSIEQLKFGADLIGLKQEMYGGVVGLQEVLKLYQAHPNNISKISFEIRTEEGILGSNNVGELIPENDKPKTVTINGNMLIPFLMNGALSELDKIDEYEVSSKKPIFKLDKDITDKEEFAIKNNLEPLFVFLMDKKVFKSRNATFSKLVELLLIVNVIKFDDKGSRDEKTQTNNFIQVLYRVFVK
jgi:hypothetical protein